MQLNFKTGPACVQMAMPHINFLYPTWPLMDRLRGWSLTSDQIRIQPRATGGTMLTIHIKQTIGLYRRPILS